PVLEALNAVPGSSARPASPAGDGPSAPGGAAVPAGSAGPAVPAAEGPAQAVTPVPDIPEPRRPAKRAHAGKGGRQDPSGPQAEVQRELVKELPVRPADVCALGRRHGRWHPDSPEARICAGVQNG
ncbi:hypothetical protein ACFXA3_33990, partial [Streptomyces sp. NPDC059456]